MARKTSNTDTPKASKYRKKARKWKSRAKALAEDLLSLIHI